MEANQAVSRGREVYDGHVGNVYQKINPSNKYSHGIVLSAHEHPVTGAVSYKVGQTNQSLSNPAHQIAVHGANLHQLYHIHQ